MKLPQKLTKKISLFLIVAILSLNFSFFALPKKADAILGVADVSVVSAPIAETLLGTQIGISGGQLGVATSKSLWDISMDLLMKLLSRFAKIAARMLIMNITRATVDWINGGYQGQPAFLGKNSNDFFFGKGGVSDQVMGDYFRDTSLSFLCSPFQLQVKLALQLGYGATLKQRIGCTLSQVTTNINNAIDTSGIILQGANGSTVTRFKDINNDVWKDWLVTTLQPQNNPIGAYTIAKADLDLRILKATGDKEKELSWGSGALSFKRCVDVYKDDKGNEISRSSEYTSGAGEKGRPLRPLGVVTVDQQCSVKTPGQTITNMLGFKATQDQRMNELTATMADGLDAIFTALVNSLMTLALRQLNKGVLDNSVDGYQANTDYLVALDQQWKLATQDYIDGMSYANSFINTDWTQTNNPVTPTITIPSVIIPPITPITYDPNTGDIIYPTSTPIIYDPNSTSTSGVWGNSTTTDQGTILYTGYSALDQAKNNANILLNSLLQSELAYQNNYKIAQNILTSGRAVFATSSACNINYGRNDTVLRSLLIRANVISNIDGISSPDRTIASIPWNLMVIKDALASSNLKITLLNKASTDVSGASSITNITDAMIPVNSTSFDTDPQASMIGSIKTWLTGVRNIYTSLLCPIDINNVLKIDSATSTGL